MPVQSVVGQTESDTRILRLFFCLVEVERQAEIFNRSFEEAMSLEPSELGELDIWRHLQSALFAATMVNRFVTLSADPPPWLGYASKTEGRTAAKAAAAWRVAELRRLLALPTDEAASPIFTVRSLRNSLEHFDERVDRAFHAPSTLSLSDWYIFDDYYLASPEVADTPHKLMAGLRAFSPETGILFFDREPLDLFLLDADMLTVRHNSREAQGELLHDLQGRCHFGRSQLLKIDRDSATRRAAHWRQNRADVQVTMAPRVVPDRLKLWMQIELSEPGDDSADR